MTAAPEAAALRHCAGLARRHYENFPVASLALPRRMRRPTTVIYAFARTGDDLADEGDRTPAERLAALDAFGTGLDRALAGERVDDPVLTASAAVIHRHALPPALFHDLLRAFRQDVVKRRYGSHDEVLEYCRCSANPVGRLLLHLAGAAGPRNLRDSDAVCTALQLVNFLQDLRQDYTEHGRIYLPADEMARHGVTEAHIRDAVTDDAMRGLLRAQLARARAGLAAGIPLGRRLGGRFGFEIRMIVAGGLRVTERLAALEGDVFARPRLRRGEVIRLAWQALTGLRGVHV